MIRSRLFFLLGVLGGAPTWSASSLYKLRSAFDASRIFDDAFTLVEIQVCLHLVVCFIAVWIIGEIILEMRRVDGRWRIGTKASWPHNRFRLVLLGLLAVTSHGSSKDIQEPRMVNEAGIPIGVLISPALATLLLIEILKRRRQQIDESRIPAVMTDDEIVKLTTVYEIAEEDNGLEPVQELDNSIPIVSELLAAVDRPHVSFSSCIDNTERSLVVSVYGYPEVRSSDGKKAEFRKKRALELAVWLSLNRDRPRRSAARTALWQVEINNSTFSTVVSEMRRGIAAMDSSIDRADVVPSTYSDELILSPLVVTDYDILRHALRMFREDNSNWERLSDCLGEIRDVPFSGTAYEWADLDGTTTRLIITAIQASQELAEYAIAVGNVDLMMTAVSAGLRVMPGCEELLSLQQSFIPATQMSRSAEFG